MLWIFKTQHSQTLTCCSFSIAWINIHICWSRGTRGPFLSFSEPLLCSVYSEALFGGCCVPSWTKFKLMQKLFYWQKNPPKISFGCWSWSIFWKVKRPFSLQKDSGIVNTLVFKADISPQLRGLFCVMSWHLRRSMAVHGRYPIWRVIVVRQ